MSIELQTSKDEIAKWRTEAISCAFNRKPVSIDGDTMRRLINDAESAHQLHALVNNPHTDEFLRAVNLEASHQRDRWGEAHDRGKSAENWFWLVGYLAGKCLRAAITGDKFKALHHTISTAAACANWFEAIKKDQTGTGIGHDNDIRPIEIARFECGGDSLETSELEARG